MLNHQAILHLHETALSLGLERHALLQGIAADFVSRIQLAASPAAQILIDLTVLNQAEHLTNGTTPLVTWLKNAHRLSEGRQEAQQFELYLGNSHLDTPTAQVPSAEHSRDGTTARRRSASSRNKASSVIKTAYLCYAGTDVAWARDKAHTLRQVGVQDFLDAHAMRERDNRSKTVHQYLRKADRFFLAWSRQAAALDTVRFEYLEALALAKSRKLERFIVIDHLDDTPLPPALAMIPSEPAIFRAPSTPVEIAIRKDFQDFTELDEQLLQRSLAQLLGIPLDQVRIATKRKGSTKIVVLLPETAAVKLLDQSSRPPAELEIDSIARYVPSDIGQRPTNQSAEPATTQESSQRLSAIPHSMWQDLARILTAVGADPRHTLLRTAVEALIPGLSLSDWGPICSILATSGPHGLAATLRILDDVQEHSFSDDLSRWAAKFIEQQLSSRADHMPLRELREFVKNEGQRWERLKYQVERLTGK